MRGSVPLAGLALAVSILPNGIPNVRAQAPPAERAARERPTFPGAIRRPPARTAPPEAPAPVETAEAAAEAPPPARGASANGAAPPPTRGASVNGAAPVETAEAAAEAPPPARGASANRAAPVETSGTAAEAPLPARGASANRAAPPPTRGAPANRAAPVEATEADRPAAGPAFSRHARARLAGDVEALDEFRPSYPFWRHVFTIPDGHIAFGSATDGRLLVAFPSRGDWRRNGDWADGSLAEALSGRGLPRRLRDRRRTVEQALERRVGPVVHNATRGRFVAPHAARYGRFLSEWSAIYERFAVPAEIGLAQAMVESGFNGRARSSARALGFCQWLPRNWNYLKRRSPHVIEGYNQTTQAPYCAAYLSVLATMYGSFIPALSEHHAGGANVLRTVVNGERLGARNTRERYLRGSDFARRLREVSIRRYRTLFRSYGPRSALYAEMVFGNVTNVRRLVEETPQSKIFAMRVPRSTPIERVMRRTGLSRDEVRRYNPALVRQVPARAHLYLPEHVEEFGPDVSFWHRPPDPRYAAVLDEFVGLDASIDEWHTDSFRRKLENFRQRFSDTGTEEGAVMATVLAFTIQDLRTSGRAAILREFRTSGQIQRLFDRGRRELADRAAQ